MSSLIRSVVAVITLALFTPAGLEGSGEMHSSPNDRALTQSFERVLDAHGGRNAIDAAEGATCRMTRVTCTAPDTFLERQIELTTSGVRFIRRTEDPLRTRTQVEIFDGRGAFAAGAKTREDEDHVIEEALPSDAGRLSGVQASNQSTGLLPILKALTGPEAEVSEQAAGSTKLRKFNVATSRGAFVIYADRGDLIRRVDRGSITMLFADVREVTPLKLPFVEKILSNGRVVFDVYFSRIELNPALPAGYFDPSRLSQR